MFSAWGTDGTIYLTWNDGWGASTGGAASGGCSANVGLTTLSSDLSLATAKNCMTSFGTQNQQNTGGWTDNYTWKSGGIIYINDGSTPTGLYWNVMRQLGVSPFTRANASIMYSTDGGTTWCAPGHSGGSCSTTGDPPAANTAEFTSLPTMNFVQYEKGGTGALTVDCQNSYIYSFSTTGDFASTYLMRAARGSNLQSAGSWQYYTGVIGGDACSLGNWSSTFSGATLMSSAPPYVVYIPSYGYLVATLASSGPLFSRASSITGTWTQAFYDSGAGNFYGSAAAMISTLTTDAGGNINLYVCFGAQYLFDTGTGSTPYSPTFRAMSINKP